MVVMRVVKNCLLVILWCVCLPAVMLAQTEKVRTVREIMDGNAAVYDLVTAYTGCSDLTENYKDKYPKFRQLFVSRDAKVYMDHLYWMNDNNSISPDKVDLIEYCNFYENQQGSFTPGSYKVLVDAIDMKTVGYDEAYYEVKVTKNYKLNLINTDMSYALIMSVRYSFRQKSAEIIDIKCKGKTSKKSSVLANYVKKDNTLYIPEHVKVNKNLFLGEKVEMLDASSYDKLLNSGSAVYQYLPDENIRSHKELYVKTVKNAVGLQLGFGHILVSNMSLNNMDMAGTFDESAKFSGSQFNVGVLYLRQLYAKNRHRVSVEVGAQFALYKQRFKANSYREDVNMEDADGAQYIRNTMVSNYNEMSRAFSLSFPVAARYDIYVIRNLSIFAMAGLKFNLMFWRPTTADFDASYSGQYGPELFNLFIDQNGYYDFGHFNGNKLNQNRSKTVGFNLASMLALGLQYHINDSWSVEACAGWQYKMTQTKNQLSNAFRLTSDNGHFQSVNEFVGEGRHAMEYQIRIKYNF